MRFKFSGISQWLNRSTNTKNFCLAILEVSPCRRLYLLNSQMIDLTVRYLNVLLDNCYLTQPL